MELPSSFYYIVGFLVVTNLSAIGGLVMIGFKTVWFASKMHSSVEDSKAMAVRAHKRIDKIEEKL